MQIKIPKWITDMAPAWKLFSAGMAIIIGLTWVTYTFGDALFTLGISLVVAAFFKMMSDP